MIEALAVFLVVAGVALALFVARVQARSRKLDPHVEQERLQQHLAWLEDRRLHAEKQNYDEDMKARIAEQLVQTRRQLVLVRAQLSHR